MNNLYRSILVGIFVLVMAVAVFADGHEKCNPLVFVEGTPTFDNTKEFLGWDKVVDCDQCSWLGTTWAKADTSTGDDVPWAIFEFEDQGFYIFDYVKFRTEYYCEPECEYKEIKHDFLQSASSQIFINQPGRHAYPTMRIEVLVSKSGTAAGDFVSVGIWRDRYAKTSMQWCKLEEQVAAKYVKLRLLEPVTEDRWTQIVEFAVDTQDKTGPKPASAAKSVALVESMDLVSAHPNPFNPTTTINYKVEQDNHVSLTVYNVSGKQVAELVNEFMSAGQYNMSWNASELPSGVYFAVLQSGAQMTTQRMLLMK